MNEIQKKLIIPQSTLFTPSEMLYNFFNVHLYADWFSSSSVTLIKPNCHLQDIPKSEEKRAMNDLVRDIQELNNNDVWIHITKDKNGKDIDKEEYFSGSHIKVDYIQSRYGKFEPHKKALWDRTEASPYDFFNRFHKSKLLSLKKTDNKTIPPLFNKLIDNLTSNPAEKSAFINWLAYYFQTLNKSRIAWIIKGEKGIGKGILMQILRNIFGIDYVYKEADAKSITANFNAHWKDKLFIVFEEVDFNGLKVEKHIIHAKLKDIITDSYINIEGKGVDKVTNYPFYSNILFFSNKANPVEIESGDRRYNVLESQTKLDSLDWFTDSTGDEMIAEYPLVAQYFANYECDKKLYNSLVESEVRAEQIENNLPDEEMFAKKLLENDIDWFLSHKSVRHTKQYNGYTWESYVRNILFSKEYLHNGDIWLERDKMMELFTVIFGCDWIITKFRNALGKGAQKNRTVNGKSVYGWFIDYVQEDEIIEEIPSVDEIITSVKDSAKTKSKMSLRKKNNVRLI